MDNNYFKYSEAYSRFWFRYLTWDFYCTKTNRRLTKGQLHNLSPDLCNDLATGADLPPRFKPLEREPAQKINRKAELKKVEA